MFPITVIRRTRINGAAVAKLDKTFYMIIDAKTVHPEHVELYATHDNETSNILDLDTHSVLAYKWMTQCLNTSMKEFGEC